jgi:glycosyltransferase involved in cell wall biosynthesis
LNPHCILIRDPRNKVGGFESWVEQLASGLPQHDIEVTVLIPNHKIKSFDLQTCLYPSNVKYIRSKNSNIEQAKTILDEIFFLTKNEKGGIFFTMPYSYINIVGINLQGSPWIPVPVMHGRHSSAFDWMCLGPPKKIIVPSEDFAKTCRKELQKRIGSIRSIGKVVTIPHGVSIPDSNLLNKKWRRPFPNKLKLIAVTRLNEEDAKRPWDYIYIAEELLKRKINNFELMIVGDGACYEKMKDYILFNGLTSNVNLIGAIAHSNIYPLILDADVLISTSEVEAFGLSVAEGLACGCPVIASDIPGAISKMVINQTGFRVSVGDIQAYADTILRFLENPYLIQEMGQNGHELIKNKFSNEKMIKEYARIIKNLCRKIQLNKHWVPRKELFQSPGEAVGMGILTKLRIPPRICQWIKSFLIKYL